MGLSRNSLFLSSIFQIGTFQTSTQNTELQTVEIVRRFVFVPKTCHTEGPIGNPNPEGCRDYTDYHISMKVIFIHSLRFYSHGREIPAAVGIW